jgi:hypothetical protein
MKEKLIRQGPARVFTRSCDRVIRREWQVWRPRHGRRSEVSGQCQMPYRRGSLKEVGDDSTHCASPPQPPHALGVSLFVDSARRPPLRVKSRLDPI